MPKTYDPIQTQTLGSAQASVTFSSIPSTYTDLVLVINGAVSVNTAGIVAQVNGDTATNYSFIELYGSGSAAGPYRLSNVSVFAASQYSLGISNTNPSTNILHFMNYANTTTYKTILLRSSDASNGTTATVNLWRSTAAINSITLKMQSTYTMNTGTVLSLYGIKAA
jgi:hypothetical protein